MSRRNGDPVVDDGSRVSGANGCRGASWSEPTATPGAERELEMNGFPVSRTTSTHLSTTTKIVVLS